MKPKTCNAVVLIGGNGSNLQALIDQSSQMHYHLCGVISHRPEAYGLVRAQNADIPTTVIDHKAYATREAFDAALIQAIEHFEADVIVMAGFMRILSAHFVHQFTGKILNIHPSLLPNYKGLNTHQRVLEAKESEHGVSIHFVTEELDGGPIVAQVKVPILSQDTPESLATRVHQAEHWLYPQVIDWFAQKRLKCHANIATLDGERLGPLGVLLNPTSQGIVS
jgi:phosphoribosylglycinamide formyltransferase-1